MLRASRVGIFLRVAGATAAGGLAGCSTAILSPAGPVGDAERTILLNSVAIMLVIVVPTLVAILSFAWWFRASNSRARYLPSWAYSGRLELIVWSIPALTILFLGGIAWLGSHDLDPARPLVSNKKPLEIQVVSFDWKWLFIYPEQGIASVNRIVAPAGIPLHFSVTSASVMNVFFVPRLGSEIYTMYGMTTQLNLMADKPGIYAGLSAQFSGDGFSDMYFDVEAVTPDEFTAWAAATRTRGPSLDDRAYEELRHQSQHVAPYTYREVVGSVFHDITAKKLPPGEGPSVGRVSTAISPRSP